MDINKAMKICLDKGLKISGGRIRNEFFVFKQVNEEKLFRFKKPLQSNEELNEAVLMTYVHYANKILTRKSN